MFANIASAHNRDELEKGVGRVIFAWSDAEMYLALGWAILGTGRVDQAWKELQHCTGFGKVAQITRAKCNMVDDPYRTGILLTAVSTLAGLAVTRNSIVHGIWFANEQGEASLVRKGQQPVTITPAILEAHVVAVGEAIHPVTVLVDHRMSRLRGG